MTKQKFYKPYIIYKDAAHQTIAIYFSPSPALMMDFHNPIKYFSSSIRGAVFKMLVIIFSQLLIKIVIVLTKTYPTKCKNKNKPTIAKHRTAKHNTGKTLKYWGTELFDFCE